MPKETRTEDEIQEIRERIVTEAVTLMTDVGFHRFSMRKLAARLQMSAANIYNYYQNRDELYLDIQTIGFEKLYQLFKGVYNSYSDPLDRLRGFARAYIEFSRNNSETYDLMFSRNTPKYADYARTEIEPTARREKDTALMVASITAQVISEVNGEDEPITSDDAIFRTIQLWSGLHGIANLYNSRVLQEVVPDADDMIKRLIDESLTLFYGDK